MSKCNIENGKIKICDELAFLFLKYDSKIEKVTMCHLSNPSDDWIGQITFRYGREKSEIVILSFCPFCGGETT